MQTADWCLFVSRRLAASALAVAVVASAGSARAAVILENPSTHLTVNGGVPGNGAVPSGGYFHYFDKIVGTSTTWSVDPILVLPGGGAVNLTASGLDDATPDGSGATSTASVSGIGITATTELVGSNARTTFSFSSTTSMAGFGFIFHAENDLFGFGDDSAAFTGSIAGGDLVLFQYDTAAGGLTVRMNAETGPGAVLSLFGSGLWTGFGTALEGGDLTVLSSDGSNFATLGDLGSALYFGLSGTSASLIINYDTQPAPPVSEVPAPSSLLLMGLGALAFSRRTKRPAIGS